METLYAEISDMLGRIELKIAFFRNESSDKSDLHNHITELKDLLNREKNDYNVSPVQRLVYVSGYFCYHRTPC